MGKQTVETLIEGGKATAAPPLGPALGPTGVNIGQVVAEINKKTADMKGMQVPVKVTVDDEDKSFTIEIGTPPAAALIKKEAGVDKGASNPLKEKVADLMIEQVMKVANMKEDALLGSDLKNRCLEIAGTCQSMGMMIEGMPAVDAIKAIKEGKFDAKFASGRTELSEEEKQRLEAEKQRLQEELKKQYEKDKAKAQTILSAMSGKDAKKIRGKMEDEGIPQKIIDELAPVEQKK